MKKSPSGNVFGKAAIGRGSAAVVVVIPRLSVAMMEAGDGISWILESEKVEIPEKKKLTIKDHTCNARNGWRTDGNERTTGTHCNW